MNTYFTLIGSPHNWLECDLYIKVGILLFLLKLIPIAPGTSAENFKNMTLGVMLYLALGWAACRKHLEATFDGFSASHQYKRAQARI